jgi:hypothetical protein
MSTFAEPLTFDELNAILHYDPETGKIFWKSKTAKKIMVGMEAGCVHRTKAREDGGGYYRYIRVLKKSIPAARVAWLLHYGEWPVGKIQFVDGNTLNLTIVNLRLANSLPGTFDHSDPGSRADYMREHREAFPMEWKDTHLQRTFGISLAEYGQMLVAQNGVCAVCGGEEKATRNGKVKALCVDHDHATGKVRGLLCSECNQMIGKAKDSRDILLAAVKYLDKHSGRDTKPTLTVVPSEDMK